MAVDVEAVAETLGGRRLLGATIRSLGDLNEAVQRGLPKQAIRAVAARIYVDAARQRIWIYSIVPQATFKRRGERLSAAESEKTERVARVVAQANRVWGDEARAREFLTTSHPLLRGHKPIEEAVTDLGARQVEEILDAIEHGLPV
jgi:putative toxin-antitoxin system antitoxin component (TIGR02293 family)